MRLAGHIIGVVKGSHRDGAEAVSTTTRVKTQLSCAGWCGLGWPVRSARVRDDLCPHSTQVEPQPLMCRAEPLRLLLFGHVRRLRGTACRQLLKRPLARKHRDVVTMLSTGCGHQHYALHQLTVAVLICPSAARQPAPPPTATSLTPSCDYPARLPDIRTPTTPDDPV